MGEVLLIMVLATCAFSCLYIKLEMEKLEERVKNLEKPGRCSCKEVLKYIPQQKE